MKWKLPTGTNLKTKSAKDEVKWKLPTGTNLKAKSQLKRKWNENYPLVLTSKQKVS